MTLNDTQYAQIRQDSQVHATFISTQCISAMQVWVIRGDQTSIWISQLMFMICLVTTSNGSIMTAARQCCHHGEPSWPSDPRPPTCLPYLQVSCLKKDSEQKELSWRFSTGFGQGHCFLQRVCKDLNQFFCLPCQQMPVCTVCTDTVSQRPCSLT